MIAGWVMASRLVTDAQRSTNARERPTGWLWANMRRLGAWLVGVADLPPKHHPDMSRTLPGHSVQSRTRLSIFTRTFSDVGMETSEMSG